MSMPTSARGRGLLGAAGWLLAVVTAIVVGLTAVDALGRGIVEPVAEPLTQGQVAAEASALDLATPGPQTPATPTPATPPPPSSSASPTATVSTGATPGTTTSSPASTSNPGAAGPSDVAPAEPNVDPAPDSAPPPPPAAPPASPPPPPPAQGGTDVTSTVGGTVVSYCLAGEATLTSWTPAIGFAIENLDIGPDHEVGLRFDSETVRVDVEVTCSGDQPIVATDLDDDR